MHCMCVELAVLGNMTVCNIFKRELLIKIYALVTTSAYKFLLCHHYVVHNHTVHVMKI